MAKKWQLADYTQVNGCISAYTSLPLVEDVLIPVSADGRERRAFCLCHAMLPWNASVRKLRTDDLLESLVSSQSTGCLPSIATYLPV